MRNPWIWLFFLALSLGFAKPPAPLAAGKDRELAGEEIRGPLGLPPVPPREWEVPGTRVGPIVTRVRPGENRKSWMPNPAGALWGKSVYLSPGHGWYWTGSGWTTQRGYSEGAVEDLSNAENVSQFLVPCLLAAGAHVVPLREIDTTARMVIVDNDDGQEPTERGQYREVGDPSLFSNSSLTGFRVFSGSIPSGTNPFSSGTNRLMNTDSAETARAVYTLNVPADGYYNVYISYSSYSQRAPDAHVIVQHPGGQAHFRVDQRHHGLTWVFLGRFWFKAGVSETEGSVVLANDSAYAGTDIQVSLDAVRIGGGMGFIDRSGGVSGKPRYEEACRYHAQFAGAPDTVYDSSSSADNSDDVSCRSRLAAWIHETGEDAVFVSWHSNAGGGRGTSTYVYGPNPPDGTYNFTGAPGSDRLAVHIEDRVVRYFRTLEGTWRDRGVFSAYFGELNPSYNNEMPSALLEILFHDSAADMYWYLQPAVRRASGRAVCHAVLAYFAERDGTPLVLPPDPPVGLRVTNAGLGRVEIAWSAPPPDSAGGDPPSGYRVYIGPTAASFDDGQLVEGTSLTLENLNPGDFFFVKVHAVNAAGESAFGTPPAAVRVSATGRANILILDAFTRLDTGMNWMQNLGYADPVHRIVMQRIQDFREGIKHHAPELASLDMAFDTWQSEALAQDSPDWSRYDLIDLMAGRGADAFDPQLWDTVAQAVFAGSHLLVTGSGFLPQLVDANRTDLMSQLLGVESITAEPDASVAFAADGVFHDIPGTGIGYVEGLNFDAADRVSLSPGSALDAAGYGSGTHAGLQNVTTGGEVFTFGFPLETIPDFAVRREIFARLVDHLGIEAPQPDAGVDVVEDADADSDTPEPDAGPCGPHKVCHTERVYGCQCSHGGGAGGGLFFPSLLLVAFLLGFRRRFSLFSRR